MAGGFALATGGFLDGDARAVPQHVLDKLAALSAGSLEALVAAAAVDMTRDHTTSVNDDPNAASAVQPDQFPGVSEADTRDIYAAVCAIVATCARDNVLQSAAAQRQQLYAMGIEDDALQTTLLPLLGAAVPKLQRVLEQTSFDFAHVVDVKWRLDYVLRSSSAGRVHEPLYLVQLKLQPPSPQAELEKLVFSCSVEELRALVYRIQEAANEIEKLAAGTPSQLRTTV